MDDNIKQFLSVLILSSISVSAYGINDQKLQNLIKDLPSLGATYNQSENNVNIYIDQKKLLDAAPLLIQKDMLTQKDYETKANQLPIIMAYNYGMFFNVFIIIYQYRTMPVDKVHYNLYIVLTDNKGQKNQHLCYTVDLDRDLYKNTDWENASKNILLRMPTFKGTEWCNNQFNEEMLKANIIKLKP